MWPLTPFQVDVVPDLLDWLTTVGTLAAVAVSVGVAIVESRRARAAEREKEELVAAQQLSQRRAIARLVSAWIEKRYEPAEDRTHYKLKYVAHIINESDLSVSNVSPCVAIFFGDSIEQKPTILGSLSLPRRIAVFPPRRELEFDLSIPLQAHRRLDDESGLMEYEPRLEIRFTDPSEISWVREYDGRLVETRDVATHFLAITDDAEVLAQVGPGHAYNPMSVALSFLTTLTDESINDSVAISRLKKILSPTAEGWKPVTSNTLQTLREGLSDYSLATHIKYPVPNVAYIRLIQNMPESVMVSKGVGIALPAQVITLTFTQELGWRVFTFGGGGTPPDRIHFPDGMD